MDDSPVNGMELPGILLSAGVHSLSTGARQARCQALAGKGGEHNAPLRRAVIGGLIFATIATPIIVPAMLRMVHDKWQPKAAEAGGELSAT